MGAMRKALVVFVLVFALVLSGAVYAISDASAPRDKVEVTEIVRYGEPSAAEGLSLVLHNHFDFHLFWDVAYTPTHPEATETDYRVSEQKDYGIYDDFYLGINFMSDLDYAYFQYLDGETISEELLGGLGRAYYELWQETPPGEAREKQIYLKDYLDYYPIGGEVDLPYTYVHFYEHEMRYEEYNAAVHALINEYFKIPVMEDECRYISIRKDENGNLSGHGGGSGDGDSYQVWTNSVILPDAIYFTINNRTMEDKIVDTSLIPGGYGIYRLPYHASEGGGEVYFEEMSTVKSLDEEFDITYFLTDEAKEKLILIGKINSQLRMLVIDAATMEKLQDIEIVSTGNVGCWQYFDGGDFLALSIDDNRLGLIVRQESGEYTVRFVVEDIADGTYYNRYDVQDMAWNGEKLALSGYKGLDDINERFVADFYYAVFDETGLLCFTDCDSSLCINNDQQWGCVRGNDVDSMTLDWR